MAWNLHEVLTNDDEMLEQSACEGLSVVHRPTYFNVSDFRGVLRRLQQLISVGKTEELMQFLCDTVPGFANQRLIAEMADADAPIAPARPSAM
ncbi:MAG: hypothetical protein BWY76_02819 [bacterium ADurb.Bin429]|nr:MAG: hypothetical protein BWY76_02819 [bacterium ADurb.Bin429]